MWGKGVCLTILIIAALIVLCAQPVFSVDISGCSALNTAGETYTLTQDIWNSTNTTCMDIQANNIILDCQGNRIDGVDGINTWGVRILNPDNVTVRNCEISDWMNGIRLSSSTNDKIYNNFITSNTQRGISILSDSNYNNFTNNTIFFNQEYGILLYYSYNNNISYSNVSKNTYHGVYLSNSDGNRIEHTIVSLNDQSGIYVELSDGNVVSGSNITSNQMNGVRISGSSGNSIEGGKIKLNTNSGVYLNQSSNNNITGVNCSDNGLYGIHFDSSSNSNIVDNIIVWYNDNNGIMFSNSLYNRILNSDIRSNVGWGVLMNYASNNNITSGRLISNQGGGVRISYSPNCWVRDALITNSGSYEVQVTDSSSSNSYFVNTTFDKNDVDVTLSSVMWVRWYLQIQVRDNLGSPLGGANVSIMDKFNNSRFNGQTNSSGYIPRQTLNEYNQTSGGKFFYTDYALNVNKTGYSTDQESENLTASRFLVIYLQEIVPLSVQTKTYTRALVEASVFKPNRMVRTRATVTSIEGRDYISNVTIVIKDHAGTTKVNNVEMTNVSQVTNGYVYEYNYTLPGNAQGLWLINVSATDDENRKDHDFRKIAVVTLNFQVKLMLNDTWDSASIYIPGSGEKTFAQLGQISPYTDVNPPDYYLASYLNNVLLSLVLSPDNPLSIYASTGSGKYEMRMDQRFSNSLIFLVFSRGNWRQVNNRIGMIEKGEFLSQISPTFSYGLGDKYPLKIVLSYDNIDVNNTLSVGRGYNRISIENLGASGNNVKIGVERV